MLPLILLPVPPSVPPRDFPWGWAHTCSNDGASAKNATLDQAHNLKVLGLAHTDLLLMQ